MEKRNKKKLIIVDLSSFIFRSFYAIRPLTAPDGSPVNAVYGVYSMLLKVMASYRPTHIFLARDSKKKSFRHETYADYKANRSAPPDDLIPQFAMIETLLNKMRLKHHMEEGFEADDVIGSAATQWKKRFDEIFIVSGDKDLMQFVGDNVFMLDTKLEKTYGRDEVKEKMGVWPEQIVDYLSLLGDASDNIPGVKGIGAKGAAKLLEDHGSLDEAFKKLDQIKNNRLREALANSIDDAYLSRELVGIKQDIKLHLSEDDIEYHFAAFPELVDYLNHLGFKGHVKKLLDMPMPDSDNDTSEVAQKKESKSAKYHVQTINSESEFKKVVQLIVEKGEVAYFPIYSSDDLFEKGMQQIALTVDGQKLFVLNFEGEKNISFKTILRAKKDLWENKKVLFIGHNIKRDIIFLKNLKVDFIADYFDIGQAHYLIDVSLKHDLTFLAGHLLDLNIGDDPSERAYALYHLYLKFKEELSSKGLDKVFYEIDNPLVRVLALMEYEGVAINTDYLKQLEMEYVTELDQIQLQIEHVAGSPVNLNSPKQVAELLFEKLGLPVIEKTKTQNSTNSDVLEELEYRGLSEVPRLILRYRELDKLLNTYITVLPEMIHVKDKRVHTTYNLALTATGRLSSEKPNLQNIPIRTESGRRIRKAFVATPGNLLFSADYSQVELRILAHFSGDEKMLEAFQKGIDIHTQTASEVMGVAVTEVTSEMRSSAKAVNFGLMYGQSSFGLARNLKISRGEAKDYITRYFERFQRVKMYLDSLKDLCAEKGYVETLFGRRRDLPDIRSQNRVLKSNAERMAINTPIQGTAADLVKLAMINIQRKIEQKHLKTKMILQVHDELIFDVPENEIDQVRKLVISEMEGVQDLNTPLKVDTGLGVNWYDLK